MESFRMRLIVQLLVLALAPLLLAVTVAGVVAMRLAEHERSRRIAHRFDRGLVAPADRIAETVSERVRGMTDVAGALGRAGTVSQAGLAHVREWADISIEALAHDLEIQPIDDDAAVRSGPWFRRSEDAGEDGWHLRVTVPVVDPAVRRPTAALSGTIDLDDLDEDLARRFDEQLGSEEAVAILDPRDEPVVLRGGAQAALARVLAGGALAGGDPAAVEEDGWPTALGPMERADAGGRRLWRAPLRTRGWSVVLLEPNPSLIASLGVAPQTALLVLAITAVPVWLLVLGLHRMVTVPIRRVTDAHADLAAGVHGVRARRSSTREFDRLIESFNDMADRLEGAHERLEDELQRQQAMAVSLQISEERYRTFLESSVEGVMRIEFEPPIDVGWPVEQQVRMIVDRGRVAECNDALARSVGFGTTEDVRGRPLRSIINSDLDSATERLRSFVRDHYRIVDAVSRERGVDGVVRHLVKSAYGVVRDGHLVRVWVVQRDETERHEAEQRLRESEAKHRDLVETSRELIWSVDAEGRWTFLNPAATRIYQRPIELMLGRRFLEFTAGEFTDRDRRVHEQIMAGQPVFDFETAHLRRDGSKVVLLFNAIPKLDADGRVVGTTGTAVDITERQRTAEALRESEARYRSIVDYAPESIVVFDADLGRLVEVNDKAVEFFELDRETLLQSHPSDISPPCQPDGRPSESAARAMLQRALAGERPVFEWIHRTGTGRLVPCEVRLMHMPSRDRRLIRGTIVDIGDRKAAEQRQQLMMAELDHRVKNTLASVLSLARLTAHGSQSIDDFTERFSGRIASLARVHDMLAESRWEGVDLRTVLEVTVAPYRGASGEVELVGPHVRLPARMAAPTSMVLHEMATNASKHGALSGSDGRLRVEWSEIDDGRVRIEWTERSTTRVAPGTDPGVGTGLIRGFVTRELGGEIELEWNEAGLQARILLPLDRAAAEQTALTPA